MKNLLTIALLFSLTSVVHAECRCVKHSPQDHLDVSDARPLAHEVGKNMPRHIASDVKENANQLKKDIKDDMNNAKNTIQNSKTVQSAKESFKCLCDKSKCAMHNAKQKAEDVFDETQELACQAGQVAKEVVAKAGNTIKETAYKVGHDISEGAMEAKADFIKAKERAKRS